MKGLKVAEQVALVRLMGEFLGQVPWGRRGITGCALTPFGWRWWAHYCKSDAKGVIFIRLCFVIFASPGKWGRLHQRPFWLHSRFNQCI